MCVFDAAIRLADGNLSSRAPVGRGSAGVGRAAVSASSPGGPPWLVVPPSPAYASARWVVSNRAAIAATCTTKAGSRVTLRPLKPHSFERVGPRSNLSEKLAPSFTADSLAHRAPRRTPWRPSASLSRASVSAPVDEKRIEPDPLSLRLGDHFDHPLRRSRKRIFTLTEEWRLFPSKIMGHPAFLNTTVAVCAAAVAGRAC